MLFQAHGLLIKKGYMKIQMSMKKLSLGILLLSSSMAFAQPDIEGGPIPSNPLSPGTLDGVYMETHVPLKKPIPYDYLREADAIWTKRVWRSIDLREKMNHPLYYPLEKKMSVMNPLTGADDFMTFDNSRQLSLWRVIKKHAFDKVVTGNVPDITIFFVSYDDEPSFPMDGDGFKYPHVPMNGNYRDTAYLTKLASMFNMVQFGGMVEEYDQDGNLVYDMVTGQPKMKQLPDKYIPITSEEIIKYDIKEEWFFDKERSVLDVRILGIAPVVGEKDANGKLNGKERRLFWIYFPECRPVFSRYFVFNTKNDAMRLSYDDLFWKRQFASYVTKENNVYDREINDFKLGVDALLESERIKELIFTFEQDVWHF